MQFHRRFWQDREDLERLKAKCNDQHNFEVSCRNDDPVWKLQKIEYGIKTSEVEAFFQQYSVLHLFVALASHMIEK